MQGDAKQDDAAMRIARPIAVGPFSVRFSSTVPDLTQRWDELFAGFDDAEPDGDPLDIRVVTNEGTLLSTINGAAVLVDSDPREHELALSREINQRKLDAEPQRIHVHSAAVAQGEQAVILVGRSGDGKSTLTARLAQRGWDYVTDEQVTFDDDDELVMPYPRPLTLRRGSWHLFPGIGDGLGATSPRRVETSIRELGGRYATRPVRPAVLLGPRYVPATVTHELSPLLTAAEAVLLVESCCLDLERTGTRGMSALIRLACSVPAYQLIFSDVDQAALLVGDALASGASFRPRSCRRIDAPEASPVAAGLLHRSPGSTAWLFDDGSGIAFHPTALRIARLDTLACALWQSLEQPDTVDSIVADAPDERIAGELGQWIAMLLAAGLLAVS